MERTYLAKQSGRTMVWVTDDPDKIEMLTREPSSVIRHTVKLKGHEFELFISAPDTEHLRNDPEASVAFARDFMTNDSSQLMDWARVLLL